eukprot:c24696_g1_i2 orf=99-1244(+)
MVLSNKKLKQRLRLEGTQQQGDLPTGTSTITSTSSDKPTPTNKREKKKQRRQPVENSSAQQAASPDTPIDQTELDTYNRCIETLLHEQNGAQGAHTDPRPTHSQGTEVPVPKSKDAEKGLSDVTSLNKPNAKSLKRKTANERNSRMQQQEGKAPAQSAEDQDLNDPRTVYVGGIPYYSSEDDIRAFFADCGTISEVNLKTFSDSGKFRGIALLTFKTVEGAHRALALDGANMGDRFLKIQPSAPKSKEAVKKEVYNVPPSKTEGYTRAYIGNLSWDITEEDIREFFKDCKINSVKFSEDKVTGDFKGFGHVDFADDESLELALQLDQQILLERPIKVAYALPNRTENKAGTAARDRKDITCYTCGEKGHISSRCPYMGRGT